MPNSQFIKISKKVLDMDISNEAKILYTLLVAKINYSKYKDKKGKYFFLSRDYYCKTTDWNFNYKKDHWLRKYSREENIPNITYTL